MEIEMFLTITICTYVKLNHLKMELFLNVKLDCLKLLNIKTVLFQTIQFSISTQFNSQKHFYF